MNREVIPPREVEGWCGPASLAWAIFKLIDCYPLQSEIAEKHYNPALGTSGESMILAAKEHGLNAAWVKADLDYFQTLKDNGAEIILSWMAGSDELEDGHYSVFKSATADTVTIYDPSWIGSISTFDRKSFEKVWYDWDNNDKRAYNCGLVIWKANQAGST